MTNDREEHDNLFPCFENRMIYAFDLLTEYYSLHVHPYICFNDTCTQTFLLCIFCLLILQNYVKVKGQTLILKLFVD